MRLWDIWLAYVPFEEDDRRYSKRPALVLRHSTRVKYWVAIKMTSHAPRRGYPGEYRIKRWRDAGLSRPTTIRISKITSIHEDDFIHYVGSLQRQDATNVLRIMSELYVQHPHQTLVSDALRDVIAGTVTEALNQAPHIPDTPQARPQSTSSRQRRNQHK